ncbi:MAG: hypothetical protein RL112_2812 [Planctomycetota bacterium]
MTRKKPDASDADIVLKLYDLRREKVMRESRDAVFGFAPKTWDEMVAILQPDHPRNAAYRQVSSYYEMAYGFARHGAVNAELLAESTVEGLVLYAKVRPFLARLRAEHSPFAFANAEWMVKKSKHAKARFALIQERVRRQGTPAKDEPVPKAKKG